MDSSDGSISLLLEMKEQGKEVGMTYWESPERKCLNECRLPLPADIEAAMMMAEEGGGGGGRGGVDGGSARKAKSGKEQARRQRQVRGLSMTPVSYQECF